MSDVVSENHRRKDTSGVRDSELEVDVETCLVRRRLDLCRLVVLSLFTPEETCRRELERRGGGETARAERSVEETCRTRRTELGFLDTAGSSERRGGEELVSVSLRYVGRFYLDVDPKISSSCFSTRFVNDERRGTSFGGAEAMHFPCPWGPGCPFRGNLETVHCTGLCFRHLGEEKLRRGKEREQRSGTRDLRTQAPMWANVSGEPASPGPRGARCQTAEVGAGLEIFIRFRPYNQWIQGTKETPKSPTIFMEKDALTALSLRSLCDLKLVGARMFCRSPCFVSKNPRALRGALRVLFALSRRSSSHRSPWRSLGDGMTPGDGAHGALMALSWRSHGDLGAPSLSGQFQVAERAP
ncbi:hypothetical protein Bbelb_410750 [Branchiostoma belcheri]|nr:hypothetical protein Bbelb_410750 [Branchiostoma belcheri]